MALTHTQQALLEIQRIETRLMELKRSLRYKPDTGQREAVAKELTQARVYANHAAKLEKR